MGRILELKEQLDEASGEVLALLADGPKKTGDLIEGLGYSCVNFLLTKAIGDGNGEWDQSPHQLALSDLVDAGEVQWCYDEEGNVAYGPKGTWPAESCGENSAVVARVERFLDTVVNKIAKPFYDSKGNQAEPEPQGLVWGAMGWNVRKVWDTEGTGCMSLFWNFGKSVQVIGYDFCVGAGDDEPVVEFD